MKTYVSILRGINVSGQRMIKMTELTKMFENLHFNRVKTYIQSGNVIFQSGPQSDKELQVQIQRALRITFSFEVPVLVLDEEELTAVQEHNPFLKGRNEDISKLHVTFLEEVPESELVEKLQETAQYLPDEWIISGKTVYLFCPAGYGNTRLNNNFFEKKLKVSATTRNWKTVNELLRMVKESASQP